MNLIKLKTFCTEMNHKQNEKTTLRMEEKITSKATDKSLISKIHKKNSNSLT